MIELRVEPLLLVVADDLLAALPAAEVLAASGVLAQVAGEPHGREHLRLLRAQGHRVERGGLLHRGQGEQLHEVVLDDVAGGTDAVVVPGPAGDPDVLGHGDLHVVDVVGVPDRLEHLVGEPQGQEVLHGLFAQVVVDPEDVVRPEHLRHDVVQLARAGQVVAERLLDDHPAPGVVLGLGQPGPGQLLADQRERGRWHRQVERVVAAGAPVGVKVLDRVAEAVEGLGVVEAARRRTGSPRTAGARSPRGTGYGRTP